MNLKMISHNFGIKIISFVLALVMWFYVETTTGKNPFIHKPNVVSPNLVALLIPIEPQFRGRPPKGYYLNREKTGVIPEKTLVVGHKTITEQVTKLYTVPINITGFERTTELEVPLQVLGQQLEAKDIMVKVKIVIEKE